jgi:hypothetical protein
MAEAIMDAALMVLAGVPEMNQVLTLCGFYELIEQARLVNHELLTDLDSIDDYSDDAIESMAKRVDRPGARWTNWWFWYRSYHEAQNSCILGLKTMPGRCNDYN